VEGEVKAALSGLLFLAVAGPNLECGTAIPNYFDYELARVSIK
jgi:hypothetical protein